MRSISYSGIRDGEPHSIQALVEAATTDGFFGLELDCPEGQTLHGNVRFLENFAKEVLDEPETIKQQWHFHHINRFRTTGYKPLGSEEGAKKGKPDAFELFMLPQNELLLDSHSQYLNCPPVIMSQQDRLTQCMRDYETAAQMVMKRTSEALGLGTLFIDTHDTSLPSVTNLGLLKYPPQPSSCENFGHIAHTDVGSLTLLTATERGLQIIDPTTDDWIFVDNTDRHVFVQFGDSLKFLSGGKIVPSIHRVVPSDTHPGATKYTVAYFVRPNEKATIVTDDGTVWLYEDYHCRKFDAFARPLGWKRPDGEDGLISIREYNNGGRIQSDAKTTTTTESVVAVAAA